MRCSKCGAENPDRAKFCVECAAPFARRCASCGAENPSHARFCLECSKPIGNAVGSESQSPGQSTSSSIKVNGSGLAVLEGERKTVTALFADIKGSMDMMEGVDPEEARAIVDPALKLMMDAVHRYGGYVAQSTGDGIFALFGAPVAHEDHPQRAVYAALRMQEEMRRYSAKLRQSGDLPLEARVGVNTGEVVVRSIATGEGHAEYTPIGHSISLAARMQALAPTGSIAVTDTTRRLIEGYFSLRALGPTKVKGVSEAVEVFEVVGLGALRTRLQRSAVRGYTKFVGREREMEALRHAAELASNGRGQIAAAVAMAGVGKSRLFYEFKLKNQSGWMVLEAISFSHGKATAYLPVVDLLQAYFRIAPEDDPRTRREKLAGRIAILDRALEDTLPYLYGLLGLTEGDDPLAEMDPQIRKRRTLEALKRILLRESLNQPLMVMFEDLHWIDDETQAFLNLLADSIGTVKILLLVNYRPEYSHHWNSKTYYTQLRLDPLGGNSAGEMVDALLGVSAQRIDESLAALKRLIVEKTEGTPLFMEEIVQALVEEGALVRNGTVKLTRPLDALKIPPTVQGILASRIDRLPHAEKELLQTLAVIGMEFPLALARRVINKPDDELDRMLDRLQLAEFVYEQPAAGDTEYTFKHALTQEVAYNSVLQERRKLIHGAIGHSIEALYADSLDDHVTELARHYRRGANAVKAIDYIQLAAEQALGRNARDEALAGLKDGLALLAGIEDQEERVGREATLQLAFANALAFGDAAAPGVEDAYLRARELCERTGDRAGVFKALMGLRVNYAFRAQLGRSLELCEELLKIAQNAEPGQQLLAHAGVSHSLYFLGNFSAARDHLEQIQGVMVGATRFGAWLPDPRSQAGRVLCALGYPDRARRAAREALADARQRGIPFALGLAEFCSAFVYYLLREVGKVREHGETARRLATESGSALLSAITGGFLGWVEAMSGVAAEGIRDIEHARKMLDTAGNKLRSLHLELLIQCHIRNGTVEEGLSVATEALSWAEHSGEKCCAAEINRLTGKLLLMLPAPRQDQAESAFRNAIEVARTQQARWFELRATVSLARLLGASGRRDEARTMLTEIYRWFTEGFDTADLQDARKLIQELKA